MSYDPSKRTRGTLPRISVKALILLVISGSVATVFFDIWGQVISPGILGWAQLSPAPLGQQTIKVLFGINSKAAGHFMHLFAVGLIAYPIGYVYIFRPIFERLAPKAHWLPGAALYGFGLFIVAIGIVAGPLLAGNPWFLNWTGITWVALIGHTLYGIVCGWMVKTLEHNGIG